MMRLQINEEGVLDFAPETVEVDKKEMEILSKFLDENPDIREKLEQFANNQHKEG